MQGVFLLGCCNVYHSGKISFSCSFSATASLVLIAVSGIRPMELMPHSTRKAANSRSTGVTDSISVGATYAFNIVMLFLIFFSQGNLSIFTVFAFSLGIVKNLILVTFKNSSELREKNYIYGKRQYTMILNFQGILMILLFKTTKVAITFGWLQILFWVLWFQWQLFYSKFRYYFEILNRKDKSETKYSGKKYLMHLFPDVPKK